jgi:hypothetical protein
MILNSGDQNKDHLYIVSVEDSYMNALSQVGVEFSLDFYLDSTGSAKGLDPDEKHRVPLSEIFKSWARWENW